MMKGSSSSKYEVGEVIWVAKDAILSGCFIGNQEESVKLCDGKEKALISSMHLMDSCVSGVDKSGKGNEPLSNSSLAMESGVSKIEVSVEPKASSNSFEDKPVGVGKRDKNWKRFSVVEVISFGHGGCIFKFLDERTKLEVLESGPCVIGGQLLFLKQWCPNLISGMNGVTRVPIWAKFHGVPLEYWTPKGLSHIASVVGVPLYMDIITKYGARLDFAKVCLEMDSSSDFKESFELKLPNGEIASIKVEYSWKPFTCAWCKTFGHA
ncbi:uncharacterized protein LOC116118762 [Pistacia vera]|uniref:uncharacterized protein LOC116118762 n=1 Tax=Pistacia vera TaxID=55513 RepID=UPI001263B74D|nr:uncharacterized protein LOC116118762 [Pistacia vera]